MNIKIFAFDLGNKIREIASLPDAETLDSVSLRLPKGLYSTFRTYDGAKRVVGLKRHLNRLEQFSPADDFKPSATSSEIRQGLRNILGDFVLTEAKIRISLSLSDEPGQIYVMVEKLKPVAEITYLEGVKVVTSKTKRINPREKSTNFIVESEQERLSLQTRGIYEALMVHDDHILEGLTSNFFAVKNAKIITARNDILLGVTRRMMLRLFYKLGIPVEYRKLRVDEIASIDEAFITSSSRGVVPVIDIDGVRIGQGAPGHVAKLLRDAYDNYVIEIAESI